VPRAAHSFTHDSTTQRFIITPHPPNHHHVSLSHAQLSDPCLPRHTPNIHVPLMPHTSTTPSSDTDYFTLRRPHRPKPLLPCTSLTSLSDLLNPSPGTAAASSALLHSAQQRKLKDAQDQVQSLKTTRRQKNTRKHTPRTRAECSFSSAIDVERGRKARSWTQNRECHVLGI
jgi:hypothetical protein